ncbi:MAG TPA: 16S rRNA (adenine(1518)-N(6)/adenine(1519)-N(6))-dimethyltransferase, partial [Lachnoclostridium sp.]|nr:16S rRNA (adenine(1518)-N(6)/adenine(1519)-N(6))-dimethyltransferase [Lachnoclostridium sp.]
TKQQAQEAIAAAGFSPTIRGEALTLKEFAKLADTVGQMG